MNDMLLLSLIISFTVSVGWIVFIYKLDKHQKEPVALLIKLFVLGFLIGFPIGFINLTNMALFGMMGALILVGFTEEGGKYLVVRYGAFKHKAFDEPIDGVVYASMVALGFAFSENIDYNLVMLEMDNGDTVPGLIARGFTPFLHVLISSIWGMQMAYYKRRIISFKKLMTGLFIAALIHSGYDLLVGIVPLLMIVVLISFSIYFMKKIRHLNRISPYNNGEDINCPHCEQLTEVNSLFCKSCGQKIEDI